MSTAVSYKMLFYDHRLKYLFSRKLLLLRQNNLLGWSRGNSPPGWRRGNSPPGQTPGQRKIQPRIQSPTDHPNHQWPFPWFLNLNLQSNPRILNPRILRNLLFVASKAAEVVEVAEEEVPAEERRLQKSKFKC